MAIELRQYQRDAANSAWTGYFKDGHKRQLMVLPTGGGKTCVFNTMAAHPRLQPALILAHREELVLQAADKYRKITGTDTGILKAELDASLDDRVVVASIQSIMQPKRLGQWPRDHFEFIVCDEAHHVMSDSWLRVLNHFDEAKVLGVTATPHRGDKRNLGKFFQNVCYEISLFELIRQGFLSNIKIQTVNLSIAVEDKGRELSDREAASAIEPILESVADATLQHAATKKTLIFLPLRETSRKFMAMLRKRGLRAEHVDGEDPNRKEKLAAFSRGEITHLCNAMLLTEGYDEPSVECVIPLRPTTSQPLYSQMVGRGTRLHPGKEYLLLLDFLWMHQRHKLVRPAHLVAPDDKIALAITKIAEEMAQGGGPAEAAPVELDKLFSSAVAEREEKLRKELEEKARKAERTVDIMDFALNTHDESLYDYEPVQEWESMPPSERQLQLLKQFGIDPKSVKYAGQAKEVIGKFMYRSRLGLATPKQLRLLRQLGHPAPHTETEGGASVWIEARLKHMKGKR